MQEIYNRGKRRETFKQKQDGKTKRKRRLPQKVRYRINRQKQAKENKNEWMERGRMSE